MFCARYPSISCRALALFTSVYWATEATVLCPCSRSAASAPAEGEACSEGWECGSLDVDVSRPDLEKNAWRQSQIILCLGLFKCQWEYTAYSRKTRRNMSSGGKLHLKTQTKQRLAFHTESVCLRGVSLGFVIRVNLCVSLVVCVFKGEESGRLGVKYWLQWCDKYIHSTLSNNKHTVVNMFEYR